MPDLDNITESAMLASLRAEAEALVAAGEADESEAAEWF